MRAAKRSDEGVGREKNARDEIISPLRPRVPLGAARHRAAIRLAVSTGPATDLEGCSFLDLCCRERESSERQQRLRGKSTRGTATL